jgi:hypothetical protein
MNHRRNDIFGPGASPGSFELGESSISNDGESVNGITSYLLNGAKVIECLHKRAD